MAGFLQHIISFGLADFSPDIRNEVCYFMCKILTAKRPEDDDGPKEILVQMLVSSG